MANEAEDLKKIQEELKKVLDLKKTVRDLGREDTNTYKQTLQDLQSQNGSLKQFQQLQKQVNRDLIEAKSSISGIRDAFAASVDELTGMNAGLNRTKKSFKGLESIADKLSNDQADISRLSLKELKTVEEKVNKKIQELKVSKSTLQNEVDTLKHQKNLGTKEKEKLKIKKEALKATEQELSDFKNGIGLSNKLIEQAKDRIKAEKTIEKTMGTAPAILGGIGKSLQKIGLPDFGVSEAVQNTENIIRLKNEEYDLAKKIKVEATKENIERLKAAGATKKRIEYEENKLEALNNKSSKRVSSTEALSTLMGEVGKKIKDQITPANLIQGAFTLLVSSMMQVDKLTGQLAKNIGVSYDESLAMQKNFTQIAISSDEIMVSTAELNKGFMSLNQQFNGATGFSNELVQSFTALTTQAGFTEETIGNIAKITGTQGDELNNNVALMEGQLEVMNAQNGTSFSSKQVLEGIGKVSKATLLTLRNQPKALARTLMTSKKLALSFAEMESISSSLLDFEGSIGAELEAELLTGKNLNLENARQLALKGDIAGAAAEVAKQVGSAAEFEKMNVIQQEALAKATGLTRDQLANSLIEREALTKLGGKDKTALEAYNRLKESGLYTEKQIAKKLGNEKLAEQLKSQSAQERFSASVARLKEIFNDVAQAIMPIASTIADMIVGISKFVANFSPVLKPLLLIYGTFKGIQLLIGGIRSGLTSMAAIKKSILMFSKGEHTFQQASLVTNKRANILKKLGLITDEQSRMAKARATILDKKGLLVGKQKNLYANAGLGTQLKANIQAKLSNVYEGIKKQFTKEGLFYKGAILAKDLAIQAALLANNGLTAIGLGFNKENLVLKGLIFIKDQAINVVKGIGNALGLTSLSTTVAEGAAESVITGAKVAQNASMGGLISKGLIYLGTLVAQAAAAIAGASALTLGLGTIGILAAAAAGIAYLYSISKPKKAGDMMGAANGKTQVSTAEGGLFELSSNDQFVAAPGIADAAKASNKSKSNPVVVESTGGGNSVKELNAIAGTLKSLVNINTKIANKNSTIELAGEKVGAGIAQSERQIQ
tara:strand:+ start:3682 stop:6870 length:3189 start_codon:yes stop_codon:yes gene_type:complete